VIEVRSCNGDGPACGCGERSALHVKDGGDGDYFLCALCTIAAAEGYLRYVGQEDQGPPTAYFAGLLAREHELHGKPVRWCPKCEAAA
jgi:hypothetical protein